VAGEAVRLTGFDAPTEDSGADNDGPGVSPLVQFLIVLIGLGVAIDYSLLVVSRWREERSHGAGDWAPPAHRRQG
jgi:uncharacterized membrane protein YdfJ with MMPL/SSD domain